MRKNKQGQYRIFRAYLRSCGLPAPIPEYSFHDLRKWRFDFAWPDQMLALEVQGGLFVQGRHVQGGALIKEYEKLNAAALDGWTVLLVTPQQLLTKFTSDLLRVALANGDEQQEALRLFHVEHERLV